MYGMALAGFLTALCVPSQPARADVTAVVNEGTLEITATPGEMQGVLLTGLLTEGISVFVDGTLLKTFPRAGVSRIDVFGVTGVTFQHFGMGGVGFEFEGDIVVDMFTGGVFYPSNLSSLNGLRLRGDLLLRDNSGFGFGIEQEFSLALIDGNLTVQDGVFIFPRFSPSLLCITGDLKIGSQSASVGGVLENVFIGRDLIVDGGPRNEFIELRNVIVEGDAVMSLGQSTGGDQSEFDADWLSISRSTIKGDLVIDGEQGDDTVRLGFLKIEGNLGIDMGAGADEVRFSSNLTFGSESKIFLDGGNGNSDELILNGLTLNADEHTGFETVTP